MKKPEPSFQMPSGTALCAQTFQFAGKPYRCTRAAGHEGNCRFVEDKSASTKTRKETK
jgi:hypothetical protein